jgi:hypothetical protein
MMNRVWFVMTEVRAFKSSPGDTLPAAAHVECFVPADQIRDALNRAETALLRDGYEIVDISRCIRLDVNDWNYEEYPEGSETFIIVRRVLARGNVEFGPFYFWSEE